MVGRLAVSLAGHDKGTLYLIVREEENSVYLADGIFKKYASPKKKNRKHIQQVLHGLSEMDMEELKAHPADADTKIKRSIKLFYERNHGGNLCQKQM